MLVKKKFFTANVFIQGWLQLLNKQGLLNLTIAVSLAGRMFYRIPIYHIFQPKNYIRPRNLVNYFYFHPSKKL